MDNADLRVTCEAAPVQIEGMVRGTYVYFRERYGQWTFSTADNIYRDGMVLRAGASCDEFMDVRKAMALTEALADIYVP